MIAVHPYAREVTSMCECSKCCKPEKLEGKLEECSPEQIKECHGDSGEHPCVQPETEKK